MLQFKGFPRCATQGENLGEIYNLEGLAFSLFELIDFAVGF